MITYTNDSAMRIPTPPNSSAVGHGLHILRNFIKAKRQAAERFSLAQ